MFHNASTQVGYIHGPVQSGDRVYLAALPPGLLSTSSRCQGFRVRAGCESGAAPRHCHTVTYCQTWRRSYSPSGYRVCLLLGVTGSLGMDASSSSSKYPLNEQGLSDHYPFFLRANSPWYNQCVSLSYQRRSQEYNLAASRERRSADHRTQKNSR